MTIHFFTIFLKLFIAWKLLINKLQKSAEGNLKEIPNPGLKENLVKFFKVYLFSPYYIYYSVAFILHLEIFTIVLLHIGKRKEGNDQESIQLPNTFRSKTPKGKKEALKATTPQSKHYKQK